MPVPRAYVLIKVRPGKDREVLEDLKNNDAVCTADFIIGPYDIIAMVEAPSFEAISNLVLKFGRLAGIENTTLCAIVEA